MAAPTLNTNVTRSIAQTAQYIQEKWTRDIQQPFDKKLQKEYSRSFSVLFIGGIHTKKRASISIP